MEIERFQPVMLEPVGAARLTEHGKRFMSRRMEGIDRHWPVLHDMFTLAHAEQRRWPAIEAALRIEGVPVAISSGLSGYSMLKLIDHVNGKTSFTMPAAVAMALGTAAPTVATTGVWGATETTNYTGYARLAFTTANWTAAAGTNPAAATYSSAGAVTFAGCSGGSPTTELGFIVTDNATLNSGNALWYGTLASVVISPTQTPPTLATNALSVSLNGT
jgi:hypothetical protein